MLNGSLSWKRNLLADVFFLHQVSVATSHPTLPFMLLFSISPCRDRRGGMQKHRRSTQSAGMEPCSTLQVAGWWFIFFYNIIYISGYIYSMCVYGIYSIHILCVFSFCKRPGRMTKVDKFTQLTMTRMVLAMGWNMFAAMLKPPTRLLLMTSWLSLICFRWPQRRLVLPQDSPGCWARYSVTRASSKLALDSSNPASAVCSHRQLLYILKWFETIKLRRSHFSPHKESCWSLASQSDGCPFHEYTKPTQTLWTIQEKRLVTQPLAAQPFHWRSRHDLQRLAASYPHLECFRCMNATLDVQDSFMTLRREKGQSTGLSALCAEHFGLPLSKRLQLSCNSKKKHVDYLWLFWLKTWRLFVAGVHRIDLLGKLCHPEGKRSSGWDLTGTSIAIIAGRIFKDLQGFNYLQGSSRGIKKKQVNSIYPLLKLPGKPATGEHDRWVKNSSSMQPWTPFVSWAWHESFQQRSCKHRILRHKRNAAEHEWVGHGRMTTGSLFFAFDHPSQHRCSSQYQVQSVGEKLVVSAVGTLPAADAEEKPWGESTSSIFSVPKPHKIFEAPQNIDPKAG